MAAAAGARARGPLWPPRGRAARAPAARGRGAGAATGRARAGGERALGR